MINIFRAYDIRGRYSDDINATIATKIDVALAYILKDTLRRLSCVLKDPDYNSFYIPVRYTKIATTFSIGTSALSRA